MDCYSGIVEASGHVRQKRLRDPGHGLVDINKSGGFDARMFEDFSQNATVSSTNDKDVFWIRVRVEGEMGDHLLVTRKK
jgi:hypothetical protein